MSNHDERQGILLPIVLPIGLLCVIALVLFGFSRILLASSARAAVAVALTALLAVIGVASFVAARPRVSGASLVSMVTAVLGVTMLAGGLAVIAAPLVTEGEGGEAQTVVLAAPPGAAAEGFSTDTLEAASDVPIDLEFDNQDPSVGHNVVIFDGDDENAPVLVQGTVITGPDKATYKVEALPEGTYFFHCELHPATMVGELSSVPGGGGAGGGGGGGAPGGTTVTAQGLQFDTDQIDLPAGQPSSITFDNQDAGIPHNIAIYGDASLADVLFQGELLTGPGSTDYAVPALDAGEYFFHCDVHPDMQGTVVVAGG
jgi:plastocyanin